MDSTEQQASARRKPRKLNRNSIPPQSTRAESNGGVAIAETVPKLAPATAPQPPTTDKELSVREQQPDKLGIPTKPADTQPDPPQSRRKPRKLNQKRSTNTAEESQPAPLYSKEASPEPVNNEIEALKGRVRELEGQVRELYERPQSFTGRSPRRRGKGRKGSQDALGIPGEELTKLQEELVTAQNDLATLRAKAATTPKPESARSDQARMGTPPPTSTAQKPDAAPRKRWRKKRQPVSVPISDDEVEDVPRSDIPGVEEVDAGAPNKAVTLSGNYKIKLPDNLNMRDVRAIQDGVTSVSNVARTIAANRASAAANRAPQAAEADGEGRGKSWGQWFGSYSQSIARLMHNVEADAAMESTPIAPRQMDGPGVGQRRMPIRSGSARQVRNTPGPVGSENSALVPRNRPPIQGRIATTGSIADSLMT